LDFELTEEQKDIQRAAREFAEGEFTRELAVELDRKEEFPFDLWKKACKLGFIPVNLGLLVHISQKNMVDKVLEFWRML